MAGQKIWLRAETKPAEARSACQYLLPLPHIDAMAVLTHSLRFVVTPTTCKALMDAGYDVTVERSTQRIFDG
jgi:saccharopine dehydrogenase (NAD+, L-lysine-forming)